MQWHPHSAHVPVDTVVIKQAESIIIDWTFYNQGDLYNSAFPDALKLPLFSCEDFLGAL